MSWAEVAEALPKAHSIAFDGCHKIYILLDEEQTQVMADCGYDQNDTEGGSRLFLAADLSPEIMLAQLHDWFDASCFLKFIYAVHTVEGDPNDGFEALIRQGEFEDEEDEEDE